MEVNTSGETMQSRNNSSRRWAHAGVIFSPPWHGMPIGDARWKRLIQQCVTGCNWGQKRRDSRSNGTHHHFAGVEAHPYLHRDAMGTADLLVVAADGILHA